MTQLQALVSLLVSVCYDTVPSLGVVAGDTAQCAMTQLQALVSLLVSMCYDTAPSLGVVAGVNAMYHSHKTRRSFAQRLHAVSRHT